MVSGRPAADSHLCVLSPNKWSDQNEYVTRSWDAHARRAPMRTWASDAIIMIMIIIIIMIIVTTLIIIIIDNMKIDN